MAAQQAHHATLIHKQVAFRSLTEGMDTTTASGELLFHVFGALAQYERALIQERVVAGLAAARRRGRIGGRPQSITGEKLDAILASLDGGMSKAAVCRNFGVKRTTLIETLARGLAPPVNHASLPVLPAVEFIALAARRLSRPAGTLLQLLHDSDLRGSWVGE